MKKVLMTAYAVNPLKGSEDGMGWHYIKQAARLHQVVAVTRHNNKPAIDAYMTATMEGNEELYSHISFLYFDWPSWMLFWKKGPLLSMIYYYCWQLTLALWLLRKGTDADLVHNLNFHNDWTPSFLWLLRKPFVWGPVGHHPRIPKAFVRVYGRKEYLKDRMLWLLKWSFWNLDPLLRLTRKKANHIWCMHDDAVQRLKLKSRYWMHPSIAAPSVSVPAATSDSFTVLSVGRFVALKGFDVTVRSFASFYRSLPEDQRQNVKLLLVGKGPAKELIHHLIREEGIAPVTELLDWMPQQELEKVYSRTSVFLYPSHEGAGMVVAEAMAYHIPVLCWNNAGPGTIVHPDSALKVDYNGYKLSVQGFANKLGQLYRDQEFYKQEAALSGCRFAASLDWDVKSAQLHHFYSSALQ